MRVFSESIPPKKKNDGNRSALFGEENKREEKTALGYLRKGLGSLLPRKNKKKRECSGMRNLSKEKEEKKKKRSGLIVGKGLSWRVEKKKGGASPHLSQGREEGERNRQRNGSPIFYLLDVEKKKKRLNSIFMVAKKKKKLMVWEKVWFSGRQGKKKSEKRSCTVRQGGEKGKGREMGVPGIRFLQLEAACKAGKKSLKVPLLGENKAYQLN